MISFSLNVDLLLRNSQFHPHLRDQHICSKLYQVQVCLLLAQKCSSLQSQIRDTSASLKIFFAVAVDLKNVLKHFRWYLVPAAIIGHSHQPNE